jgi:ABC-type amino acid transport substrate-binding protein
MEWLKKFSALLAIFVFCCCSFSSLAQQKKLTIGLIDTPPFTILSAQTYTGITPLIWQKIAELNHWDYQYVVLGSNIDENLQKVMNGSIDVLAEPISITHARLINNEFTRPFLIQKFATVVVAKPAYQKIFQDFLRNALGVIGLASIIGFLCYIHLIWFFERGKLKEMPKNYANAISYLLWIHLLKKRIGMPETTYGRIILFIWIILTGLFFTSYNASITSALTTALNDHHQPTYDDLRGLSIVCIAGEATIQFAQESGLSITIVDSMQQAFTLLREKKVDVLITNYIAAKNYQSMHPEKQKYAIDPLENENYEAAFAVAVHSPLRRPIDLALTELQDSNEIINICKKYLNQNDAKLCEL